MRPHHSSAHPLHATPTNARSLSSSPLFFPSRPGLRSIDTKVAEEAVHRQRTIDWTHRSNPTGHAAALHKMLFPFVYAPQLK